MRWGAWLVVLTCLWQPAARAVAQAEPSCSDKLERLLQSSHLTFERPLLRSQTLLVGLPDPRATSAALLFDGMLEALTSELGQLGYARERFALPWRHATDEEGGPAAADEVNCPGIVLYRALAGKKACAAPAGSACLDLAILIVPESATLGVNKAALRQALDWLEPTTDGASLRVLGPFYSASAKSLRSELLAHGLRYTMASGSLSVRGQAAVLEADDSDFRSYVSSLDLRRSRIRDFLGYDSGRSATDAYPMAIMQEAGTLYGGGSTDGLVRVEYPPNLSELRDAYATLQAGPPEAALLNRTRDFPYQPSPRAPVSDAMPVFAAKDALVAHDLALRASAEMLQRRRVGDIIISGVLPQDRVFLAKLLKRTTPDVRVIFDHMDRVLLHSDGARDLDGSLVITPYPMLDLDQSQPDAARSELRVTLTRDGAWGLAKALHSLMTARDVSTATFSERATIGVISGGHLWPLVSDETPRRSVPVLFWLITLVVMVLSMFNALFVLRVPECDDETPACAAQRTGFLNRSFSRLDTKIRSSDTWMARGLEACRDPLLQSRHAFAALLTQFALTGVLVVLAVTWSMIVSDDPSASQVARVARPLMFGALCAVVVSSVCAAWWRWARYRAWRSAPSAAGDAQEVGCPERTHQALLHSARPHRLAELGLLSLCLAVFFGLVVWGLLAIACDTPRAQSLFLMRSLELTSGVSPLAIVLLCGLVCYYVGLVRAAALNVLDCHFVDAASERRRHALCQAIYEEVEIARRERKLFEAVLLPGGVRYKLSVLAAVALPLLLVLQARPSAWFRPHDLTLENWQLNAALGLGVVLAFSATVASMLKLMRVYRALQQVLSQLAASEIVDGFCQVTAPLRRTVAQVIALGAQDAVERDYTRRLLEESLSREEQPAALARTGTDDAPPRTHGLLRISAPPQQAWLDVGRLASEARGKLHKLGRSQKSSAAKRLRRALASYVTCYLVPWLRQFRGLFWLVTIQTASVLCMSSLYVFSVRRMFATVGALLTLAVVGVSAWVLIGLERDEVLSRIGGTTPGQFSLGNNFGQLVKWGLLPLLLAAASYYPDVAHDVHEVLERISMR